MKTKILALLLGVCIFTTSCFSYKDINKLLIVVTTVIDIDEDNHVIMYFEVFKPYRSEQTPGGKGARLIYKSEGETILEAIRDLNYGTSQKLNFTQNKSLIFTKRAAEKGIDFFIDMLNRDQEFVLRQYLYIIEEDPEKLMQLKLAEEEYIGIYLYELPINHGATAKRFVTRLDDYLNNRLVGDEVNILPVLLISEGHLDSRLRLYKSAILKSDKYVGEMSFDDTAIYNLMTGPLKTGTLIVNEDGNAMTLEIVGSKVKSQIEYDGENIKLKYDINIRTTFASTQKPIELNLSEVRDKILENSEKNVEKKCHKLFDEWKTKGIDIFTITRKMQIQYPEVKLSVEDPIEITQMEVKVHVTMEGSSDVTDFVH